MYFYIGVSKIYPKFEIKSAEPHFYNEPNKKISEIKIKTFYFVPKNRIERASSNWTVLLENALKKILAFHKLQLGGRSNISFEIHHEPVIGLEENLFYDTSSTQHGNPEGLKRAVGELEKRGFFSKEENAYTVFIIIYEGVGASSSENIVLVSSTFLKDPRFQPIGASVLAHEFYHTLGLSDAYDFETAAPLSEDIMGQGRERPLEKTFLSKESLKKMGF